MTIFTARRALWGEEHVPPEPDLLIEADHGGSKQ
jgi:hypothetical protein